MTVQAYSTSPQWFRRLLPPRRPTPAPTQAQAPTPDQGPIARLLEIGEGQRGLSFDQLFGPYLADARRVTITDKYIHQFYQARNVMELLETIVRYRADNQPVAVHLITSVTQPEYAANQLIFLQKMALAAPTVDLTFTWEMIDAPLLHDRSIVTDNGWKIILGRGLDIFQWYEAKDAFDFTNRLQCNRRLRGCTITYVREE